MPPRLPLLVFTDLDGTLLDHETYSWQAAVPAIKALWNAGGGLVLASSKTAAEITVLQQEIGCADWPAIVENGAGILWPDHQARTDKADYPRLRDIIAGLPAGFRGFGDMTDQDVARLTGLTVDAAARARQRQFSEPGIWEGSDSDLDPFLAQAANSGVSARRGGRFLTLSFGKTKADAMAEVRARLVPELTVALGDAPNDVEMLETADFGIIVQNPAAPPLAALAGEACGRIRRTAKAGPAGWADAMLDVLRTRQPSEGAAPHG